MDLKDVIDDLKLRGPEAPKLSAVAQRVRLYGIRTICMMCGNEGRHRPGQGRLRDRGCIECGMQRLRARWWVEKYPTKAHAELKRVRGTSFLV